MNTKKLYYEDCHIKTFSATVLACEEAKDGWNVILDQTAFYPEGGGQACDLGTLGQAQVLFVKETGESVVHLCDRALPVGENVSGAIDFDRRLDLMQQHTGEHILSGIIHKKYGYHNTGFHVGINTVTIDFDGMIPQEDIPELENLANAIVWDNRPLKCWYPAPEELPSIPYRSKRALDPPVRIVEVPDTDICACCGVHVAYTGEVGAIKLLSCVKFHQGVRMELVCGKRALRWFQDIYEQNRLVSQAFSAKVLETGAAAQKMNEQLAAEKFRANMLQKKAFQATAANYTGKGNVLHFGEDLTPGEVRELADAIAAVCGGIAAVAAENGESYALCLIGDGAKELGAEAAKALNGRGGGKPGTFQGSVSAGKEEIVAFFKEHSF